MSPGMVLLDKARFLGAGVVHAGAHRGQEIDDYRRRNLSMVLFEPLPSPFLTLAARATQAGSGVIAVNKALGASRGKTRMNVDDGNDGMSSSVLAPAPLLAAQYPWIKFPGALDVEQTTIDDWFDESGLDPASYGLLVLDVQGYEIEVLKGARDKLNTTQAIISEVSTEALYEGSALIGDVDALLSSHGFSRIAEEWQGGNWGNALYQRIPR